MFNSKLTTDLIEKVSTISVKLTDLQDYCETTRMINEEKDKIENKIIELEKDLESVSNKLEVEVQKIIKDSQTGKPKRNLIRIPNYDTLSTLMDRVIIEIVKKTHFLLMLKEAKNDEKSNLSKKVEMQSKIISALKLKLVQYFNVSIASGTYRYMKEERTFI